MARDGKAGDGLAEELKALVRARVSREPKLSVKNVSAAWRSNLPGWFGLGPNGSRSVLECHDLEPKSSACSATRINAGTLSK